MHGLVNRAIQCFIRDTYGFPAWEEIARAAVAELGAEAQIEKITDTEAILAWDVLKTPGLVVNGKLVSSGRIPTTATIAEWIRAA